MWNDATVKRLNVPTCWWWSWLKTYLIKMIAMLHEIDILVMLWAEHSVWKEHRTITTNYHHVAVRVAQFHRRAKINFTNNALWLCCLGRGREKPPRSVSRSEKNPRVKEDYMYVSDITQQVKQQNKKQTTFIAKRTIANCLMNWPVVRQSRISPQQQTATNILPKPCSMSTAAHIYS